MNFSKTLINWYLENKRQLPWRKTSNPYHIWLSEIILQQTRIDQGKPYYLKFVHHFPTVFDLASASEEKVLKLWQGLGYYSRARNLHASAKIIAYQNNGILPTSYKKLLKLKGVGDYTASAIASICYQEPVAVLDGNVFRVLSRIYGIHLPINSSEGKKTFKKLAQQLLDPADPSTFNQALMEFGALQCKPKNPDCNTCPFAQICVAFQKHQIPQLPVKLKTQKIKNRHFNYLVFISAEKETLIEQRTGKGIWQNLYQFPLVETTGETQSENLVAEDAFQEYVKSKEPQLELYNQKPLIHKLSHQHIHTKFWILHCEDLPSEGISLQKLKDFPVSALIGKFIESYGF